MDSVIAVDIVAGSLILGLLAAFLWLQPQRVDRRRRRRMFRTRVDESIHLLRHLHTLTSVDRRAPAFDEARFIRELHSLTLAWREAQLALDRLATDCQQPEENEALMVLSRVWDALLDEIRRGGMWTSQEGA